MADDFILKMPRPVAKQLFELLHQYTGTRVPISKENGLYDVYLELWREFVAECYGVP